jgi:HSP20 family protein
MTVELWRPFRELSGLREWMDKFIDDYAASSTHLRPETFSLAIDLVENDKAFELKASVPGFKPEDVQVDINQDVLTVRGEMKEETEKKEGKYVYKERRSGSFYRQVRLPVQVDVERADATLKEGILTIILPKTTEVVSHKLQVKNA